MSGSEDPGNSASGHHNEDPKTLYLSSPADVNSLQSIQKIITSAYKSIGYNVIYVKMPANRSLYESNLGVMVDGETVRTRYVDDKMYSAIRIPVPVSSLSFSAYTNRKKLEIESWQDLKNYSLTVNRGYLFSEEKTKNFNVTKAENTEQALALLQNNRVEVAVLLKSEADYLINKLGYQGLIALEPPLETVKVYHYLNAKHKALIPRLTQEIGKLTGNKIDD